MPTSKSNTKTIGITIGDPGGIGPEVVAKALAKLKRTGSVRFMIIGDQFVHEKYSPVKRRDTDFFDTKFLSAKQWKTGRISEINAKASLHYLKTALDLIDSRVISALVTAPVSKEGIILSDHSFTGHTEFLAQHSRCKTVGMMFVGKSLRTVIVTRHIPLAKVASALNEKMILDTICLTDTALKKQFNIKTPKIAVCGLNPHAGEGGKMGTEEISTIIPAIKKCRKKRINADGPFPADTLFNPSRTKGYDCIIAMYHDQGLIPVKSLYFNEVVNLTIGLPFIRTSPAHGTAFDIAGKNKADPASMIEAIRLAVQLSK
ncbi:MAG: 4-hydroxythreonine-4-phosphate dehydrogenase PdxA [Candidatus Omnitrophota bacterium]